MSDRILLIKTSRGIKNQKGKYPTALSAVFERGSSSPSFSTLPCSQIVLEEGVEGEGEKRDITPKPVLCARVSQQNDAARHPQPDRMQPAYLLHTYNTYITHRRTYSHQSMSHSVLQTVIPFLFALHPAPRPPQPPRHALLTPWLALYRDGCIQSINMLHQMGAGDMNNTAESSAKSKKTENEKDEAQREHRLPFAGRAARGTLQQLSSS